MKKRPLRGALSRVFFVSFSKSKANQPNLAKVDKTFASCPFAHQRLGLPRGWRAREDAGGELV